MGIVRIGLDEVGRGALAGPVVVGAVSLADINTAHLLAELARVLRFEGLGDSKKMTRLQRERAFAFLENKIIWAVGEASSKEIDCIGLNPAITLAAERALFKLPTQPDKILADAGLHHPFEKEIPTEHFIKGDEQIPEIALASVMAKVYRDNLMRDLRLVYPEYGFESNVGYGTAQHLKAVKKAGLTEEHRRSFSIEGY